MNKYRAVKVKASGYNQRTGDIFGERHNLLTALKFSHVNKWQQSVWLWRCECGGSKLITVGQVRYGHIKSCGCLLRKHLKDLHAKHTLPFGEASFNTLYYHRKRQSKARGFEWDIEKQAFRALSLMPCTYCGVPPSQKHLGCNNGTINGPFTYNGLDRVDNARGYTLDNVAPCCGVCNRAKATMTKDAFLGWIRRAYNHAIKIRK